MNLITWIPGNNSPVIISKTGLLAQSGLLGLVTIWISLLIKLKSGKLIPFFAFTLLNSEPLVGLLANAIKLADSCLLLPGRI